MSGGLSHEGLGKPAVQASVFVPVHVCLCMHACALVHVCTPVACVHKHNGEGQVPKYCD